MRRPYSPFVACVSASGHAPRAYTRAHLGACARATQAAARSVGRPSARSGDRVIMHTFALALRAPLRDDFRRHSSVLVFIIMNTPTIFKGLGDHASILWAERLVQ